VQPLLAKKFRTIAWDQPGHGDSYRLVDHVTIEQYAEALRAFVQALGLEKVRLSGASIGGHIATVYAARWPQDVAHLCMVEAPMRSRDWYAENWEMFEGMNAIPVVDFEQLKGRFRALSAAEHRRWNVDRCKAGAWTMVDCAWAVREYDHMKTTSALKVPLTIMVGDKGPTIEEVDRFRALHPAVKIVTFADCGHFPMIDAPEQFAQESVQAFS
jgi:pimeloyl-ACP methyl ester carboxylesterase